MDWTGIIGSLASLITAVAVLISVIGVHRKVTEVATEVRTANGITLAALADRGEGRRIEQDVPAGERTSSEQAYVEKLHEGGRDL
jgi:hypothetical protein